MRRSTRFAQLVAVEGRTRSEDEWSARCLQAVRDSCNASRSKSKPLRHSETQRMRNTTRKGFTLIELLIVVVIIGILAAIAIPKFANTKSKAYIAAMKSDLRNLVTAEESYFSDSAKYAADTSKGMKFK